jgi:rubrerythrin
LSDSLKNLKAAFAGESQANRRYLAFAKKAEEEGLLQIAKLFRATAEAETVHAINHLRIAGEIGMTVGNLKEAISGETFEYTKMYPEFLEVARREGNKRAEWSFNVANKVEEIHAGLFKKTLQSIENNKIIPSTDYYICNVCGHTSENEAPEKCPVCGAPRNQYKEIK